jgi:hypothetical protein
MSACTTRPGIIISTAHSWERNASRRVKKLELLERPIVPCRRRSPCSGGGGRGILEGFQSRSKQRNEEWGARTVLRHASGKTDRLSRWALTIQARRDANVAGRWPTNSRGSPRRCWRGNGPISQIGWAVPTSNPPLDPIHREISHHENCEGEETPDGKTGQTGVLRSRPAYIYTR